MNQNGGGAFGRKVGGVVFALIILSAALYFFSQSMQPETGGAGEAALAAERIKPVGAVRSGEAGAEALAQAQAAAAAAAPAPEEVVVDGPSVYDGLCKTCHDTGVAEAPIKGSEQMAARLDEKGLDMLVQNAINGLNAMPPRGGNPSLTDEQIRAAVEFMLP